MNALDIINQLKTANFDTPSETDQFVQVAMASGAVDAAFVIKGLEALTAKGAATNPQIFRKRAQTFGRVAETVIDVSLFTAYVRAFKVCDMSMRPVLITLMTKVKDLPKYAELQAVMNTPDTALRRAVAEAFVQLAGKPAYDRLVDVLKDKKHPGRLEALDGAVKIAGAHSLPLLRDVVQGGTIEEKELALKFMADTKFFGATPVPDVVPVAALALHDAQEAVVVSGITAFNKHCSEDQWFDAIAPFVDSDKLPLIRTSLDGLRRFASARSIRVLERKLQAGPNAVRFAVLGVLESLACDEVLSPLIIALGHKQISVRQRAAEVLTAIGRTGKVDIARTIIWLLRSRDVNVRRQALEIAKGIKDPNNELWPKLLVVLRDEDWWVRERVIDVLIEMAGLNLTKHVVGFMSDKSDIVRRFAVGVLARLKDPNALGTLVRAFQGDEDWWVRERAVEAVAAIGDMRAVPYLEELVVNNADLRLSAIEGLVTLNARGSAARVAQCLKQPELEIRLAALKALQKFGDPAMGPAVQPLLTDAEANVRSLAREILTHWNIAFPGETGQFLEGGSMLDKLLVGMARLEGDDLILLSGRTPMIKRLGRTVPLTKNELTAEQMKALLMPLLTAQQMEDMERLKDIDFSYTVKGNDLRFRANIFQEHGGIAAVFRIVKGNVPKIETLGLPQVIRGLGELSNGLVLVGGPTGSGKSTTLAALIDYINRTTSRHIISLEDPIEVVHPSQKGLVTQREIGTHARSYEEALRSTLREDPDVILVGELRDLQTIAFAVTAAETGHLVFGTVHTVSVDSSVDRLINAFPSAQQDQVRNMLSQSLRAVCCQYLIKGADGKSRHLATEVMLNNDAIAALIRKGKTFQLPSVISTAREEGMHLMDSELMRLFKEGKITIDEAYVKARSKKEFEPFVSGPPGADGKVTAAPGPAPSAPGPVPSASAPRPSQPQAAPAGPRPSGPMPIPRPSGAGGR